MLGHSILRTFNNIGFDLPGRRFPGYRKLSSTQRIALSSREAVRLDVGHGDLLFAEGVLDTIKLDMLAFDDTGQDALGSLGLTANSSVDLKSFDSDAVLGWLESQGGTRQTNLKSYRIADKHDGLILKADRPLIVWLFRPETTFDLISGYSGGTVSIHHKLADVHAPFLPPLLGDTREEFTVARGTAFAYEVRPGEVVQIIDVEGQQCSDFMAFRRDGIESGLEWMIDSTATRSMVRRAYPTPGLFDKFYDREMRPLLVLEQDTCGRHDTFGLACTARGYEERGFPGHVNCSDNMSNALSPYGLARRSAWPAINFFWNTWIDPHDQSLLTEESYSRPGDYVAMRAVEDLVCVSTACPDDIDPINGWNPTDVHVRIYRPDQPIRRAVAYREKEDAPMSLSQNSAFHERLTLLTNHFAPARNLWAPVSFPSSGTLGEYWACREAVTIQDMSGLRKYDIVGPDAAKLMQLATTRNVEKLAVWRASYTLMCDESGTVIDDGVLQRLAPELFRWCCGSEESVRTLRALALEHNLQARIHESQNTLPNLSLQGPRSRDLLRKIVFTQPQVPSLEQLKWFGLTVARLNNFQGAPFLLSRTGYTGELGYEIFCSKSDAIEIWDAISQAGEEFGLTPMGTAALDIVRIEAGLAARGGEFGPEIDAFEAGLGFAVDLKKGDFTGKAALERNARDPRRVLKGLLIGSDDVPAHGAPVLSGERQVGVVTSATRSPMLQHAIAMARVSIEHAANDTALEIGLLDGRMKRLDAKVTEVPFIDPERKRARA